MSGDAHLLGHRRIHAFHGDRDFRLGKPVISDFDGDEDRLMGLAAGIDAGDG